jgi:hypothetical protein
MGLLLKFLKIAIFRYVWLLIYGVSLSVILLGAMGILDKHGALERSANKIISNSTGLSIEQLEELEGVNSNDQTKNRKPHRKRNNS